jgi:ubiquinone/menaquinone biosynthesis C-methylase UbiE
MTHDDTVRSRFGANAEEIAKHSHAQIERLRAELREFLAPLRGDERVLDSGTGAGTLALAIAPLVGEVVGVDLVPELLDAARRDAPPNVTFLEGDVTALPFEDFSFDLTCSRRTLHHTSRPELVVSELARTTRPERGRVFVDDQLAPMDPLAAFELDRFERRRDPSHNRMLSDGDLRDLFAANGLVLLSNRTITDSRQLDEYLGLAGCKGEEAERVKDVSPGDREHYVAQAGWYLCVNRLG